MQVQIQYYPDKTAGGITGWHWISCDSGAWDGPKQDWEESHKRWIEDMMELTNKSFHTVIQAGGNQGMYPRLLSTMFQNVYTFEPDHINFATLSQNCPFENIVKMQCALGDKVGTCEVQRHTMINTGMHTVTEGGRVPLIPIDTLMLANIDLIMLDLEGFEYQALRGAEQTIQQYKPVIFAERPSQNVIQLLDIYGYNFIGTSKMDGVFVPN